MVDFSDTPEQADAHEVVARYIGSVAWTIGGGTSEIQGNIVATRGLGLPRG